MCDSECDYDLIINLIIELMKNKYVNPYQGSVRIEKITSILNDRYDNLFTLKIKPKYKKFTKFIEEYSQYFVLLENNKIALVENINYENADKIHESDKERFNQYLKNQIISYLTKYNMCSVDDIMSNINVEIKRGDLVRFIKRFAYIFIFDSKTFMVSFHKNFNIDEYYKSNNEKNILIYENQNYEPHDYYNYYHYQKDYDQNNHYDYDQNNYNKYVTNEYYSYDNEYRKDNLNDYYNYYHRDHHKNDHYNYDQNNYNKYVTNEYYGYDNLNDYYNNYTYEDNTYYNSNLNNDNDINRNLSQ